MSGLVAKFEKGGLDATMQSWVGTGANAAIFGAGQHPSARVIAFVLTP